MQVDIAELVARSKHPFVRHAVAPTSYDEAWAHRDAAVLRGARHTVVLGPPGDVAALLRTVSEAFVPERLSVEEAARRCVPDAWAYRRQGHWHWMRAVAPVPAPSVSCDEVQDAAEIDALLDAANPGSHARPGAPGLEVWLGVRRGRRLVGVGAIRRDADGSGHLRGVSVLPAHAGRGLGRALSAALTLRAMDRPPGVATLGVYVDNARAVEIYRRLGYAVEHTFVSGQTARSSTTAAVPSR